MARFKIKSKDGNSIRYEGSPRYIGTYLKPSYLEFSEIASDYPISWEVGDYVQYDRTGLTYRLYSIPQASKNARKGTHGKAFTYSNVQFYAATKELEIAPFRDLVVNDNGIHFSTAADVVTTEAVKGIALRIQSCMDELFPGKWSIRVEDIDASTGIDINEAKDFALSGGTCLDALSKIYEMWQDLGWIHSYDSVSGINIVTIGYANMKRDDNTSDRYMYGQSNGLTAIKKNQTNKDEFATRLFVYGSDRNLISRYYNGLNIANADSVDIRNLMLPLDVWGTTNGLPDARKAYLENREAVAKYGVIPRTHYFDSQDAGADIYPSIEGMTVGKVRKALADLGETEYSPSIGIYPVDSERVDVVLLGDDTTDDGVISIGGKKNLASVTFATDNIEIENTIAAGVTEAVLGPYVIYNNSFATNGDAECIFKTDLKGFIEGHSNMESVTMNVEITDSLTKNKQVSEITSTSLIKGDDGNWQFEIPSGIKAVYEDVESDAIEVYIVLSFDIAYSSSTSVERVGLAYIESGEGRVEISRHLPKTFKICLKQVGFDINERASQGDGKAISMKTGMCAGREFIISDCVYIQESDSWEITARRQMDNTLGMMFPNTSYRIAADDAFVLTRIAMPDVYTRVAMETLLEEGRKLLERASKVQVHYEPQIDAKLMATSGRHLREGMYMLLEDDDVVDNVQDSIIIDTLNIYEDEKEIPTYRVTLRERRKVSYKGTPSATSSTDTSSASDEETAQVNVDLSAYATKEYVKKLVSTSGSDMFSFVDDTTIKTKYNLYSEGEISAGGEGEAIGTGGEGGLDEETLQKYLDENGYATQEWVDDQGYASEQSVTTLGTKVSNLSDRVTNLEAGGGTGGGDIDLTAYATKEWVEDKGYATLSAVGTALSKKQDKITNLAAIESGAAKGATAVQPESLAKVATSGSYNDLSNKPTIPAAVTEATVAGWGFTKNTGNYTKPTAGIPKSDLASAVQQSLGKADTALQTIPDEYITEDELATAIANKVDKDGDKVLSDNNYTDKDKAKLDGLSNYNDAALTQRITAAEGEIQNIKKDVSDNSDSIGDVDSRLQTIEAWHNTIGQKFSIDKDAVKLSGNFFTTGENSAAGKGEAIGGEGGGGIDYDELEDYLADKHYATETWVNQQGFAKGTIPTRVSQLTNDAQYLASITSDMVTAALGYNPFNSANFTKGNIKSTLGISDWALASTKPSYNYGEIDGTPDLSAYAKASDLNGKVDKESGKGLSTEDYTTSEKAKLASLQNYDDSALTQRVTNVESKANTNASAIESLEERASNHENAISGIASRIAMIEGWRTEWDKHISYDTQKKAVKVTGDFYATGESSASGMGEEIGDIEQLLTRLTTAENTIAQQKAQLIALGTALGALQSELEELRNQINK